MMQYETSGGKKILLETAPNTALYKLRFENGGELPSELTGLFTSELQAEKAIQVYLSKQKPKKAA